MRIIKIQNLYLTAVIGLLSTFLLDENKSSARRRFVKLISPFVDDLSEVRKTIAEKYASKDEKNEFIIKDNNYQFSFENKKLFKVDITKLNEEYQDINLLPAQANDLIVITSFIKEESVKFIENNRAGFTSENYDYVATLMELSEILTPKQNI